MGRIRDAITEATRDRIAMTDGALCEALITLIDSSSRERVAHNFERIRLLTLTDGSLSRTARETLELTAWDGPQC